MRKKEEKEMTLDLKRIKEMDARDKTGIANERITRMITTLGQTITAGEGLEISGKNTFIWHQLLKELQWRRGIMAEMLQNLDDRPSDDPADTLFEALRMTRYLLDSEKVGDADVRRAMDDLNVYLSDYLGKVLLEERLKKEEE
jgi:hypothetical protein